jgi:hypothetical protein
LSAEQWDARAPNSVASVTASTSRTCSTTSNPAG